MTSPLDSARVQFDVEHPLGDDSPPAITRVTRVLDRVLKIEKYAWLDARTSLEDLSSQLMSDGAGVQSVAWEHPKRER